MNMATKRTSQNSISAKSGSISCEVDSSQRKAIGVDAEIKASNLRRLGRIEGEISGIQRMIEDGRYCADILTQISSGQGAPGAAARPPMRKASFPCAPPCVNSRLAQGTE